MRGGDGNQLASWFLVPSSRHVPCRYSLSHRNSMRQCAALACQPFCFTTLRNIWLKTSWAAAWSSLLPSCASATLWATCVNLRLNWAHKRITSLQTVQTVKTRIQPVTDRIQPVIQPVGKNCTTRTTRKEKGFLILNNLNLCKSTGCTVFANGLYNGLYTVCTVCTGFPDGLYH